MRANLQVMGGSTEDVTLAREVQMRVTYNRVFLYDPSGPGTLEIETVQELTPGDKVMARRPITSRDLSCLSVTRKPGGGGLNQALRFSELFQRDTREADIELIDTSPPNALVADACELRGIEVTSLACHNGPVNLVGKFGGDKMTIKSPLEFANRPLDRNRRGRLAAAGATADILVIVSPKFFDVSDELLSVAQRAKRYIQPTGSLPAGLTLRLVERCHALACNVSELCSWARELGMIAPPIDEGAPDAADAAAALLFELGNSHALSLQVGAVTLGRHGCAIVDFRASCGYAVEIHASEDEVATPSGAGDFWNAAWIYYREIERLAEPHAAVAATKAVAAGIGVPDGALHVRVRDTKLARWSVPVSARRAN